jgi:cobalt/nickel transport system permease protein
MTLAVRPLAIRDSLFSRFDPRAKLISLLTLVFCIAFTRQLAPLLTGSVIALSLVGIARLPRSWFVVRLVALLVSLLPFALLVPFTISRGATLWELGWLRLTDAGLILALSLILKGVAILSLMLVLFSTAPFHRTTQAARSLGCPRVVILLANLTYRYLFLIVQEFHRLRTALRVRGYRNRANRHSLRTVGNVIGTLIVRSHDRAERVSQAMRCRGFDGQPRSREPFTFRSSDLLLSAILLAIGVGLLWWDRV